MLKQKKYIWIVLCFIALACIRFFENELFYDPYLVFFEADYLTLDSPRREMAKLILFTSVRYFLNTIISIAILYAFFNDKNLIKFSTYFYAFSFVVLISLYLYFVYNPRQEDYYLFFNVRRFLIQPIILLLLLPAFYYHRVKSDNKHIAS